MNSGLIGALGTPPLQTARIRRRTLQGQDITNVIIGENGAFMVEKSSLLGASDKVGIGAISMVTARNNRNQGATGNYSFASGYLSRASGAFSFAHTSDPSYGLAQATGVGAVSFNGIASGNFSFSGPGIFSGVAGEYATRFGAAQSVEGYSSFAHGLYCRATGNVTTALGSYSETRAANLVAIGGGQWGDSLFGKTQSVMMVVKGKTTTNSAVELFSNIGMWWSTNQRFTIPSGIVVHATIKIIGTKSDGVAIASYLRRVVIKNVAGTTSLVNSVETIGTDSASGTSVLITADDTNDALKIEVTGIASETWRWVASIEGVEVAYGT